MKTLHALRRFALALALALVLASPAADAQEPQSDLAVGLHILAPVDPALPFDLTVWLASYASDATGVVVDIDVPSATGFAELPAGCVQTGTRAARCAIAVVPRSVAGTAARFVQLRLRPIAPEQGVVADLTATATATARETDPNPQNNTTALAAAMFRTFYVTTAADSGAGSLRAAIEQASGCTGDEPCKIAFRVDPAGAPWVTIAPAAPLPAVLGRTVLLDGTTQTRFFGDTNPVGPEIEIHGGALREPTDGLVLGSACRSEILDVAINGFPGAGILAAGDEDCYLTKRDPWGSQHKITGCYIGTDPTGMTAVPNVRGIVVRYASPQWETTNLWSMWQITDNLISGNLRSGIFSERGTSRIDRNRIGVNRDLSADLGNGASGIYIGPRSDGVGIADNYVMFNREFGIAIDPAAAWIDVTGSSIGANWQGAIDIGLDGPTVSLPAGSWESPLQLPLITSATWDPLEIATVVEGVLPDPPMTIGRYTIAIYANDEPDPSGYGEGQYFLGTVIAASDGRFVFRYPGDLTGKWVAATATRSHYLGFAKPPSATSSNTQGIVSRTTEFSRVVEVK
jgi:hypothetical protein